MNLIRLATAGCAALCIGAALPSLASATDYCVAPSDGCVGTKVDSIEEALDLADDENNPDRVFLGAFVYKPQTLAGFEYLNKDAPVEIIGQGRDKTILTGEVAFAVLEVFGGAGTSVHDLTIRLPEDAPAATTGLWTRNAARRIRVFEPPLQTQNYRRGVWLIDGGTLEDSTVDIGTAQDTTGVLLGNGGVSGSGGNTVRNSSVTGRTGISAQHGAAIERSRITGLVVGIASTGELTRVSDSLVRLTGGFGHAVLAETPAISDSEVDADGLTIVTPTDADIAGATASTANVHDARVTLKNSVIRGPGSPLKASASGGGLATVSAAYSDLSPTGSIAQGNATIEKSHVTNVGAAGFNEAPGHEFELFPDSPLIDIGAPDAPQGTDLGGHARVADGNGDGIARHDIGAFELQPPAAPAPGGGEAADTLAPVISGLRARSSRVSYRISEKAGVTVKIQRRLAGRRARFRTLGTVRRSAVEGANRLRLSRRIRSKARRPGRYRAVIVAVDAAGNHSARRAAAFRVRAR
ncbi:MAG TPA: choice-of-anchor Q domain-containing protein [Thermoleophilaceae bacterium]